MPVPKPAVRQAVDPWLADDSVCRVKQVVPTATVLAAAIERMNRRSAIVLFQELAQELEDQARKLADAHHSPGDVGQLRADLASLLAWLRQTAEQHHAEAVRVTQQLADLQEQGTKAQAEFERHLGELIGAQIEQHLARAIHEASARHETIADDALEGSHRSLCFRCNAAPRDRRRSWVCLALAVLAVLLSGGLFALGAYAACRASLATCASAAAGSAAGVAGGAAAVGRPALPSQPTSAAVAATQGAGERAAASPALRHVEGSDAKTCQTTCTAPTVAAFAATFGPEQPAARLAQLSFVPQPGSMEADLLGLLQRPGPRAPHTFTMDRLRYPSASHEVNADGKDQIFRVAQILLAYPAVRIEIRGHSDGTESEVYTGPKPIPGYSLSQLRANCVMQRLQGLKVPIDRMRIRGQGSTQPIADDRTAEGRQQNRRVEIVVLPS